LLNTSPLPLRIILAALVAAGVAYLGNRLSRSLADRVAVVFVAPGLEETLKTGAALTLGAPVVVTHVVFGGIEAAYDLLAGALAPGVAARAGRGPARPRPVAAVAFGRRAGAALAGLVGHALFGVLTVAVARAAGWWPAGVGAAYVAHVGWNALVMGKVAPGR